MIPPDRDRANPRYYVNGEYSFSGCAWCKKPLVIGRCRQIDGVWYCNKCADVPENTRGIDDNAAPA